MNAPAKNTILDLDAMLDNTLDNVADIPDYVTPDNGLYMLACPKAEIKPPKEAGKASTITITYEVKETVDTEGIPTPAGSLFTERFQGTEQGLEFFKKRVIKIMNVSDLNGVPLREIMSGLADVEPFKARIVIKKTKSADGSKEYENVDIRPIHAA